MERTARLPRLDQAILDGRMVDANGSGRHLRSGESCRHRFKAMRPDERRQSRALRGGAPRLHSPAATVGRSGMSFSTLPHSHLWSIGGVIAANFAVLLLTM